MSIFRTYDIRGKYPEEIDDNITKNIGYYIVNLFNCKKILLCRDIRNNSQELKNSLINGIKFFNKDVEVVVAGITSTPMFYYILQKNDFDFGIMITASHDPKEYAGMKLWKKTNENNISIITPISYGFGEELIQQNIDKEKLDIPDNVHEVIQKDYSQDYINYLKELSKIKEVINLKNIKLVIDYSNGSSIIYKEFLNSLFDVININDEMNSDFPAHQPNPLMEESQKQCSEKIVQEKANFGIIFDGDSDRIVFLDEKGKRVDTEKILCLVVEQMIIENKEINSVTTTINMSSDLQKFFEKNNIEHYKTKIGYVFVRQKAIAENSVVSAEKSTHFSYRETGFTDSAILTLLYILKYYSKKKQENKSFSKIAAQTGITKTAIEYVIPANENAAELDKMLSAAFNYYSAKAIKTEEIDGYSFYFDDYWFNIRKSNTMPEIKITIESADDMQEDILNDVKKIILT